MEECNPDPNPMTATISINLLQGLALQPVCAALLTGRHRGLQDHWGNTGRYRWEQWEIRMKCMKRVTAAHMHTHTHTHTRTHTHTHTHTAEERSKVT